MPDKNAFGVRSEVPSFLTDDLPPAEPPAPPKDPQTPEQVQPEQPAAETPPEQPQEPTPEAPTPEETPAEEQARVWAGRFQTPEELEKSYWNIQALESRTRQQAQQVNERNMQLEQALMQVAPYLEQMQQQGQPQTQAPQPKPLPDFETNPQGWAETVQENARIAAQAEFQTWQQQQVQQSQGQQQQWEAWQAQQAQAQAAQQALPVIEAWRARTGVGLGTPQEQQVAELASAYGLPFTDGDALDFAFELTQNGQLAQAAQEWSSSVGSTAWAATPNGRSYVRRMAGAPAAGNTPAGAPTSQPRPRTAAHVETGGSGAPIESPPGDRPDQNDPFAAVLKLAAERKTRSPLFGGRT